MNTHTNLMQPGRATGPAAMAVAATLLCGILQTPPARAIEFEDGELEGRLSTTISHGVTVRVEERDPGLAADTNGNDGNLNYDRGIVSNTSKFTTDLDVRRGNVGAFVRASGFIDFENERGSRERTPLSDAAKELVGQNVEVLDAYVTGTFDIGNAIIDARLGRHVLNWGESTFIPNGVNAVNHFDVSKLRQPGSELREALLPVGLASIAVSPTHDLTIEAFYQLEWEETRIDPVGSYFSSTDYAGPGAREAVITTITSNDQGLGFGPLTPAINADLLGATLPRQVAFDPDFASVLRGPDRAPGDAGQWGLALRHFAADLNDTEFGLYVMNYHSRLPTVGAQTSSRSGLKAGLDAAQAVSTGGVVRGAAPEAVSGIASSLAIDRYVKSGEYFLEYPEDIQLYGMSFNTVLGASGWALQGEYSFRRDAPLQRAEREVLRNGLEPVLSGLPLAGFVAMAQAEAASNPGDPDAAEDAQEAGEAYQAFLDGYTPRTVQGYIRRDVSQIQATATKVFGPAMGADAVVFVTEAAVMHVHSMPDKADMPLESPAGGTLAEGAADADATSWGYRLAARLDYNNAVGAINLYPYMQFLHDVSGNSPSPSGPFVEDRTALTFGLRADYLSNWQADLSYTRHAGDGNELSDRDFVSASVKYSF